MRVGVLAVQGAFAEHISAFRALGVETIELRQGRDAGRAFDALVLPGGESTAQGKLLRELGMFEKLRRRIENGLPTLATCAGLILLAEQIENDSRKHLATLPVSVRRNAYGRQLGSFRRRGKVAGVGEVEQEYIRAPGIVSVGNGVEVLSSDPKGYTTGVRYGAQWAFAFHPELSPGLEIHRAFVESLGAGGSI